MRRVFVITYVPDDADKYEVAACLACSHPFMDDPLVYDSLEDILADEYADGSQEGACARCGRDSDELYGDEALCTGCFGPESPVTIG